MWSKIKGWKEKLLSQAGREVLIKSVLQAMPTFTMGCFKLPKSLCKDIESMIRKFWWGYKGEARKIHWVGWNKLCLPKSQGGLGFRDIENFNLALLGKQVWRLLHNTDSLLYKVFKAKFFPNCSILDSDVKLARSFAWQSILKARDIVKSGSIWRIGDGRQVRIRGDKWLPDKCACRVLSPQKNLPINARVCALIDEDSRCWDEDCVCAEFSPQEAQTIMGIPLSSRQVQDTLIWADSSSGKYTTKSAYKLLSRSPTVGTSNPSAHSSSWNHIWDLEVPNKIKHFIWRACRESLPTKKNLFTKKVLRSAACDLCHDGVEDVIHALWGY